LISPASNRRRLRVFRGRRERSAPDHHELLAHDRREVEAIRSNISAALRDSPSTVVEADKLCHQAIFMNHASGAVASPNVEVAYVDDIIWQRAKRTRPG